MLVGVGLKDLAGHQRTAVDDAGVCGPDRLDTVSFGRSDHKSVVVEATERLPAAGLPFDIRGDDRAVGCGSLVGLELENDSGRAVGLAVQRTERCGDPVGVVDAAGHRDHGSPVDHDQVRSRAVAAQDPGDGDEGVPQPSDDRPTRLVVPGVVGARLQRERPGAVLRGSSEVKGENVAVAQRCPFADPRVRVGFPLGVVLVGLRQKALEDR